MSRCRLRCACEVRVACVARVPQRPAQRPQRLLMQLPPSPSAAARHLRFVEALAPMSTRDLAESAPDGGRCPEARR